MVRSGRFAALHLGFRLDGHGWFRTSDLSRVKRCVGLGYRALDGAIPLLERTAR
jgi:hypothetical protein